jgi:IMP dehydrogenase
MAHIINEVSRTFSEYLLIPRLTTKDCTPNNINLRTPLTKFKKGETATLNLNIPLVSAIMQSVSDDNMAIALARNGGLSFVYGSQSIDNQAEMIRCVKKYKAGFVVSDANLGPNSTLEDAINLKQRKGFSTIGITEDGTPNGKLLGLVTSRDFRPGRCDKNSKIIDIMTPFSKLVVGQFGISLEEANNIIWEKKVNALPIVDTAQKLKYFVFLKDYDNHYENPNELVDSEKRILVGAEIGRAHV